jgi:multiple sugar transport system substrate-binding protein
MFTWWSGYRMEDLIKSGAVADLTEEWEGFVEEGLSADLAKAFTFNDKVYGAPINIAYWNVYYNKNLFDEYGLEEPQTWEELISVMDTLKENDVAPLGMPFEPNWTSFIWFQELLINSYPDFYEKLVVGEASYTDPEVVEVMELWKDMIESGYFSEPGDINESLVSGFSQGEIGMVLMGDWYQSYITGTGLQEGEDFSAFFLPAIKEDVGSVAIYETAPIIIPENGPNKEAAIEALRNFYKEDSQQKWTDIHKSSPMVAGVESDNAIMSKVFSSIEENNTRLIQRYWEATPPDISEFAVDQFQRFILKPEEYMDVLETIEIHAQNYWESQE